MSGFSNSSANAIINYHLRGQAAPAIRTVYFALFKADPTDAFSAGTEVNSAWYARKPAGAFAAPVNGQTTNSARVEFDPVAAAPETVTHVGVVEGANAGDVTATLLYSYPLTAPKVLGINDVYVVNAGDFTLNLV